MRPYFDSFFKYSFGGGTLASEFFPFAQATETHAALNVNEVTESPSSFATLAGDCLKLNLHVVHLVCYLGYYEDHPNMVIAQ